METVATAKANRRLAKREARLATKRRRVNRLAMADATRRVMLGRMEEDEASSRLPAGGSIIVYVGRFVRFGIAAAVEERQEEKRKENQKIQNSK